MSRTSLPACDVIFLNVCNPAAADPNLCAKIREPHRATPVIFVTDQIQFDSQIAAVLSAGHDLLARPFLNFEIALKALTHLFKTRLAVSGEKNFLPKVPEPCQTAILPLAAEKRPAETCLVASA